MIRLVRICKSNTDPVSTAAAVHTRQQHPHCKSLSEGTDTTQTTRPVHTIITHQYLSLSGNGNRVGYHGTSVLASSFVGRSSTQELFASGGQEERAAGAERSQLTG